MTPFRSTVALLGLTMTLAWRVDGQTKLPPLPDSTGWGVHVLAVARDAQGTIWVGTYGQGIFRLPLGTETWQQLRHDTTSADTAGRPDSTRSKSISWDFVHAFGFGARGEIWYGTVGNGWGLSTDGGKSWKNWTYSQLGPEWQYVAPSGIVVRGDTTVIGTADGLQITTTDGSHWTAPRTRSGWTGEPLGFAAFPPANALLIGRRLIRGTPGGLKPSADTLPCHRQASKDTLQPKSPLTMWFRRPIALSDNSFIDQTYRYGSTMGGNFQQHQGVEFNNPDGTPVYAIGKGTVVYAGRAEQGALTVTIRHDTTVTAGGKKYRIYSTYYHNSALKVKVGQKVAKGALISRVGNTGRATNDHLHLEMSASPTDSIGAIVDSLQRFPPYTTNPELWIEPLPNTGIVAGQVFDGSGKPIPQARVYGITKRDPAETPFSYAETYGDKAHSHPLYGEHFAVSDVPEGTYVVGTEIEGKKVFRAIEVEAGKLTWVVFKP